MADAVLIQVADALVLHLNGQTLSQSFTSTRVFLPHFEREKLTGLEVSVFPRSDAATPASRSKSEHTYTLDVVVRKPVDPDAAADLASMAQLTEEIAGAIENESQAGAAWTGLENDPLFVVEVLAERREYLTILTVTYLMTR